MAVSGSEPISAENLRAVIDALRSETAVSSGSASGSSEGDQTMSINLVPTLSGGDGCFEINGTELVCRRAGTYSITATATVTILGQGNTASSTATATLVSAGASHGIVSVNASADDGRYPAKAATGSITVQAQLEIGDKVRLIAAYTSSDVFGSAYCKFKATMSYSIRKIF